MWQKVLNCNPNNQTAFVATRDPAEYRRCVREMKACMNESDAEFDTTRESYRQRRGERQSREFWKKIFGNLRMRNVRVKQKLQLLCITCITQIYADLNMQLPK